jgi:hypothetical protein
VPKPKFELTKRELYLACSFAIIGFLLSTRLFVNWLGTLNPLQGLVIYYIILYIALYVLSRLGLTVFGLRIEKPLQIFGLGLITFAFFIIVNWESAYVNIVNIGNADSVSQAYFASEDGAIWFLWYDVIGIKNVDISQILTFVVTPFLMALLGGLLLEQKVSLTGDSVNRKK